MVPGDAAWVEMFISEVRERLKFSHVKSADFHSSCPTLPGSSKGQLDIAWRWGLVHS